MQEYQQQVALAQLQPAAAAPPPGSPPGSPPGGAVPAPESPPPTYRSRPGTLRPGVHITFPRLADQPASRPPTYRATQPHDRPAIPHDMAAQPPQPPKPTPSPQPDREVGLVVDHRGASFLMEQNAPTTSASVSSRATTALTEAGAAFSRLLSRGQSLPRRAATLHVDRGHARAVTANRRTATLPHQPNAAAPGNHRTTAANAALYTPPQYHRSTSDCPENGRLQYHRSTSDCPDCSRLHRFISDCPEGGRLQRLVSCDCHMRGGGGGGGMYAEAPRIVMPRQSASMDDNLQNCHNEAIRYGYLAAEGRVTPGDGTLQRNAVQYLDGVLSDIEGQGACRDCQAGDDVAAGDNRAFASSSASRENMASRGECDADECCCNQGSRERVMDTEF